MALTLEYFFHHTQERYQLTFLTPQLSLDRRISWVHLVEDVHNCSFLRGNELVITTGLETSSPKKLLSFVQQLSQRQVCGVILNTGPYIHTVPDNVTAWCSRHRLPLFSMPWEIHIADIMQEYCNAIISEKKIQEIRTDAFSAAARGSVPPELTQILEGFRGCLILAANQELSFPFFAQYTSDNVFYYAAVTLPSLPSGIRCGVSGPVANPQLAGQEIAHAYLAFQVSCIRQDPLTYFHQTGLYRIAFSIEEPEIFAHARRLLSPIQDDPALLETLRAWLEHDGSIQETAQALYLHRNTVNYRIQKLRAFLPLNTAAEKADFLLAFYLQDVENLRHK